MVMQAKASNMTESGLCKKYLETLSLRDLYPERQHCHLRHGQGPRWRSQPFQLTPSRARATCVAAIRALGTQGRALWYATCLSKARAHLDPRRSYASGELQSSARMPPHIHLHNRTPASNNVAQVVASSPHCKWPRALTPRRPPQHRVPVTRARCELDCACATIMSTLRFVCYA